MNDLGEKKNKQDGRNCYLVGWGYYSHNLEV